MFHQISFVVIALSITVSASATPLALRGVDKEMGQAKIDVLLDGQSRTFILDTGAVATVVNSDEKTAPLAGVGKLSPSGAAGRMAACDVVQVPSLKFDNLNLQNFKLARCGSDSFNLLGINALDGHIWKLDFKNPELTELPADTRADYKLFRSQSGLAGIPIYVGESDKKILQDPQLAILDTGASIGAVNRDFVKAHPEMFEDVGETELIDSGGRISKVKVYLVPILVVGKIVFEGVPFTAVDFTDLRRFGFPQADFLIGGSVIFRANWILDLKSNRFSVTP